MQKYEIAFLTPNISPKERTDIISKIEKNIKENNGEIENSFFEKKFFAYPVKKQTEGFLGSIIFSLENEKMKNFEKSLEGTEEKIIRKMIIKIKHESIKKIKEKEGEKPSFKDIKKEKVKIEKLDEKLEEILK